MSADLALDAREAPPVALPRRAITLTVEGWRCPCGALCLTVTALASHRRVAHGIARARTYAALGCAG